MMCKFNVRIFRHALAAAPWKKCYACVGDDCAPLPRLFLRSHAARLRSMTEQVSLSPVRWNDYQHLSAEPRRPYGVQASRLAWQDYGF
jgi:hypothetical protein